MRLLPVAILLSGALAGALVVVACSDSSSEGAGPAIETDGGGGGLTDAPVSPTADGDVPIEDGAVPTDGATNTDACASPPPSLDAGGACGTMEFGAVAAPFAAPSGTNTYVGGVLPAGVYDAVGAERASGSKGSWRETFVVDGAGHFTRIRQIDTGISDASLGPVTRRSGTYTTNGTNITLTYDCAQSDGVFVDAGMDTLPYDALPGSSCGATYRYGATGIRLTLKRR
jgi:hypothetical protein